MTSLYIRRNVKIHYYYYYCRKNNNNEQNGKLMSSPAALFTTMSGIPNVDSQVSTASLTDWGSRTSHVTASTFLPVNCLISLAVLSKIS